MMTNTTHAAVPKKRKEAVLSPLGVPVSIAALLSFGLITGFFYAYSVDVMPALDTLEPLGSIAAMQAINTTVRNPVFFFTFFGTPVIGLIAAWLLFMDGGKQAAICMLAASIVYFLGAFLPTALINVPMNEMLATVRLDAKDIDHNGIWNSYSPKWTFWNTLRTLFALIAMMLAGLAVWQAGKASTVRNQ